MNSLDYSSDSHNISAIFSQSSNSFATWNRERDSLHGHPTEITEAARALGILDRDGTGEQLGSIRLTDATDDFDFVQPDDGGLAFRALDRRTRTDTWLSNREEYRVSQHRHYSIDSWDPDTDDDGLTDGQELKGVTRTMAGELNEIHRAFGVGTSPADPDTDGDGYWDGWLGVYGASNSSNVVLYMEHLVDEDPGVTGDEIVQEQVGVHRVRKTTWQPDRQLMPSATSANLDGDEWTEHSNVHLGELHWRAYDPSQSGDPTDPAVTPDPTLAVEVDYYEHADSTALQVLEDVERNYRLYGMDVEFTVDGEITENQLRHFQKIDVGGPGPDSDIYVDIRPPTSFSHARTIEDEFHQDHSRLYMFITTEGAANPELLMPDWDGDPEGVASSNGFDGAILGYPEGFGFGVLIFTADHTEGPLETHLQKTTVHEIGHIIGAGRNDDNPLTTLDDTEVYSGRLFPNTSTAIDSDPTLEFVNLEGTPQREWSVMSSGWSPPVNDLPMDGRYIAFSIEEVATIEFANKDTIDD